MTVPTVSIIMPVHNAEKTLHTAIQSIKKQGISTWELIATDDGSTDTSSTILNRYAAEDNRIRTFRFETSRGAALARNAAIERADGRFIAFLDADDMWLSNKLELQIPHMMANGAALSYGPYYRLENSKWSDTSPQCADLRRLVEPRTRLSYEELLNSNEIACLTAVYDRTITGTVLMPTLFQRQDYALWLKILRPGNRAVSAEVPLGVYRSDNTKSLSANRLRSTYYTWRVYRSAEELTRWKSLRHLWTQTLSAYRRSRT